MQSIFEEIWILTYFTWCLNQNNTDRFCVFDYRNSAQGSEHEVYPTIQMRHAALERNKRCLLTYLYVSYSQNNILHVLSCIKAVF